MRERQSTPGPSPGIFFIISLPLKPWVLKMTPNSSNPEQHVTLQNACYDQESIKIDIWTHYTKEVSKIRDI